MKRLLIIAVLFFCLPAFASAAPCGPGGCGPRGVRARAAVRIARAEARKAARVARAGQTTVVTPGAATIQVQP